MKAQERVERLIAVLCFIRSIEKVELTSLKAQVRERDDKLAKFQTEYTSLREKAQKAIAQAKARGTALHLLLEHLPGADDAAGLATALVPDAALRAELLAEAQGVIAAHPALFGPALTEVAVTADLPQGRMLGTIDRLVIGEGRVLAVDYKSNRVVPERVEDVPEGILRQMAAYDAALRQLHPDKAVEVAILWTRTARLMPVPPEMLREALARATIS